mgnify:CR=1 FL=1
MLLHGEQYLEIVQQIPLSGNLKSSLEVLEVNKKGRSGSTVVLQVVTRNQAGETICINEGTLFLRGATPKSSLNMSTQSKRRELAAVNAEAPMRAADAIKKQKVPVNQAAIYRLSGDYNPLHMYCCSYFEI